ncbi:MAG TPA: pyridoxamine 5'-phosphate oxidase family protein [Dongiaceae bacterium]|nr:pyridoxamine 5'-phosphate oxidase family protein [Dongiaceae bacterium]
MNAFTPTDRSKVKRLHERGRYDRKSVYAILDAGLIAHIGYVVDGQPFVTPTAYWRDGDRLYWHGSAASRMLRSQAKGIPVCVTVTHLDGLVLARSGFHHSINYRSVMAFGTAHMVDDPAEKNRHLERFIDRVMPGRNPTLRPNDPQEVKGTSVLYMEIEEASAKVRVGPPKDDEPDYAIDCWAGVIPIAQVVGAAVPDPKLKAGVGWPEHLRRFTENRGLDGVMTENAALY